MLCFLKAFLSHFKQKLQLETGEIEEHVNKTVPCLKEVFGSFSEGCTEEKQVQVSLK